MARQIVVFLGPSSPPAAESTLPTIEDAFTRIQSLAGHWEGIDDHGDAVNAAFRVNTENDAVIETLVVSSGAHQMVTLYRQSEGVISLIHHGAGNNRPHFMVFPPRLPIHELVFEFEDTRNPFSSTAGHVHRLILRFEDMDRFTETWIFRRDRRDGSISYRFTRKGPYVGPIESIRSASPEAIEFQDV
jgi:hypothetical protein